MNTNEENTNIPLGNCFYNLSHPLLACFVIKSIIQRGKTQMLAWSMKSKLRQHIKLKKIMITKYDKPKIIIIIIS